MNTTVRNVVIIAGWAVACTAFPVVCAGVWMFRWGYADERREIQRMARGL